MMGPIPHWALQSERIHFNGQPIALVVAETFEQARHAARLVQVTYQAEAHVTDLDRVLDRALPDAATQKTQPRGNPQAALAASAVQVRADYHIPIEHHNPIEPHAAIAFWEGDHLTVFDKTPVSYTHLTLPTKA